MSCMYTTKNNKKATDETKQHEPEAIPPIDKITKCNQRVTLKQHVNNHKETTTNKKHVIHYWRNQATQGEHPE